MDKQNRPELSNYELNIGDIISRGWRLYRLNFKLIIFYAIWPSFFLLIAKVILNMPSAFVKSSSVNIVDIMFCTYPLGFLIYLGAFFVSLVFNYAMIRAFYGMLTNQAYDYSSIYSYTKARLSSVLKLCGLISVETVAFVFLDFILLFILYIIAVIPVAAVLGTTASIESIKIFVYIFIVILIILISLPYILLLIYQFQFCGFQLVSLATEEMPAGYTIVKSFRTIKYNIIKSGLFGVCLYILWYALVIFFDIPTSLILYMLTYYSGTDIPLAYIIISVIWSSIVNMLLWPLLIASLTLYYYNYKVRTEGTDLLTSIRSAKKDLKNV